LPQHSHGPYAAISEERLDIIKATFVDIRGTLGLPWVGELFELLAVYDLYLQAAWLQAKPSIRSHYFGRILSEVAQRSFDVAVRSGMPFSDHRAVVASSELEAAAVPWTHAVARDLPDAEYLDRLLPMLSRLNAATFLIATAIRDALLGRDVGNSPPRTGPDAALDVLPPEPALRLRWHDSANCDEAGPLGPRLPSKEYQLLGAWPAYLDVLRREIRPFARSEEYLQGVADLDAYATAAVRALPFPFRASGELARSMGYPTADVSTLLDTVIATQKRLNELVLHSAAMWYGWLGGNLSSDG
jgi:hypothetical protein